MADKSFKKIDESDLENVNGGYLFNTRQLCDNPRWDEQFEVIDSKGNVVGKGPTGYDARDIAIEKGESTTFLTKEQLQRLRETGNPYE